MPTQTYEGYFEDGLFLCEGKTVALPERRRVFVTVWNEPQRNEPQMKERFETKEERRAWTDEFNRLLEESMDEELNFEDFPRARLGRELIDFSEDE